MPPGREYLNYPELPASITSKTAVGGGEESLDSVLGTVFPIYNIYIGQILLTRANIKNRGLFFLNACNMLRGLLNNGIVPVLNENEAVSAAEIKVGDNDNLSALVAFWPMPTSYHC